MKFKTKQLQAQLKLEPTLSVQLSLPLVFAEEEVKEEVKKNQLNWYATGGYANLTLAAAFFGIWGLFALLYRFVPCEAPSQYEVTRFCAIIMAGFGLSLIRNEIADIFCKVFKI